MPKPKIICYCGSLRFLDTFKQVEYQSLIEGDIALLPCCMFVDIEREYGTMSDLKQKADELHKRKIDICDEVFVLNVGGYIGNSTRSEIAYAVSIGKPVKFLEALNRPVEECFVEKYFGIRNVVREDQPIKTDYGQLVNMLTMFKDEEIMKQIRHIREGEADQPSERRGNFITDPEKANETFEKLKNLDKCDAGECTDLSMIRSTEDPEATRCPTCPRPWSETKK
jgi:hypothetical protein